MDICVQNDRMQKLKEWFQHDRIVDKRTILRTLMDDFTREYKQNNPKASSQDDVIDLREDGDDEEDVVILDAPDL